MCRVPHSVCLAQILASYRGGGSPVESRLLTAIQNANSLVSCAWPMKMFRVDPLCRTTAAQTNVPRAGQHCAPARAPTEAAGRRTPHGKWVRTFMQWRRRKGSIGGAIADSKKLAYLSNSHEWYEPFILRWRKEPEFGGE